MDAQYLSHSQLFVTPGTEACQAPLSMEYSRQEYWNGLPFPSPGDLPNPRIESASLVDPEMAGGFFTTEPPIMLLAILYIYLLTILLAGSPTRIQTPLNKGLFCSQLVLNNLSLNIYVSEGIRIEFFKVPDSPIPSLEIIFLESWKSTFS